MTPPHLHAWILDLDGVVTQTAVVHARAWKMAFDEFLKRWQRDTGKVCRPFDIKTDYERYVDGKPRRDGIRSFLASRNIHVPEGTAEDEPDRATVEGIAKCKNALFHQLLERDGVAVFDDAVEKLQSWRRAGLKTAVVSSSRNCLAVMEAAGVTPLFDVRVDGQVAEQRGLPGKPHPDMFLEAARQLSVAPADAAVVEDAVAGIQAARAGDFGLVIGVARHGNAAGLHEAGADRIVERLSEV